MAIANPSQEMLMSCALATDLLLNKEEAALRYIEYAGGVKERREEKEAVIITVHGKGDTVSLSFEEYQNMKAHIELLETLAEAEDDVKNGRVAPINETFDDLRMILKGK